MPDDLSFSRGTISEINPIIDGFAASRISRLGRGEGIVDNDDVCITSDPRVADKAGHQISALCEMDLGTGLIEAQIRKELSDARCLHEGTGAPMKVYGELAITGDHQDLQSGVESKRPYRERD